MQQQLSDLLKDQELYVLLMPYIEKLLGNAVRILFSILLLAVLYIAIRAISRAFQRYIRDRVEKKKAFPEESAKRIQTLINIFVRVVYIVLFGVGLTTILSALGINIGPIITAAGIFGLAISFGAQNLVRDIINGFFIILENQVRTGDVAVINGTGGLVESINLRTIVLRDLQGIVHIFPHGIITSLSNLTKDWSAAVFDIGVAYKEDPDRVSAVIKEVADDLRNDDYFRWLILEPVEIFGVDSFGDSSVVIKARIKTKPIKQWEVGREFRKRLKKAFDKNGIEIPFPHRSVYFGEASKPIEVMLAGGKTPETTGEMKTN